MLGPDRYGIPQRVQQGQQCVSCRATGGCLLMKQRMTPRWIFTRHLICVINHPVQSASAPCKRLINQPSPESKFKSTCLTLSLHFIPLKANVGDSVRAQQNEPGLGTQEGNKRDTSQSPAPSNTSISLGCFSGFKSRHFTHSSGENLIKECHLVQKCTCTCSVHKQDTYRSL